MHNAYRGGTPDVWYSGKGGDMWVEYKWIPSVPKKGMIIPNLSPLQLDWLTKRRSEGREVAVVVGAPSGGVLMNAQSWWSLGITTKDFAAFLVTDKEIAEHIAGCCT